MDKSEVNLTDCVISGNHAGRDGSGVYMVSGSSITLKNSNITDNEADNWGGGIFAWESVVTLGGDSQVTRNAALHGGAVYLLGEKARLDITGGQAGPSKPYPGY